jgi:hypothetical protein
MGDMIWKLLHSCASGIETEVINMFNGNVGENQTCT